SSLTTSAPMSAQRVAAKGAANTVAMSRMRMPVRGEFCIVSLSVIRPVGTTSVLSRSLSVWVSGGECVCYLHVGGTSRYPDKSSQRQILRYDHRRSSSAHIDQRI